MAGKADEPSNVVKRFIKPAPAKLVSEGIGGADRDQTGGLLIANEKASHVKSRLEWTESHSGRVSLLRASDPMVEDVMADHIVTLSVTPCLRIECKFWLDDHGWNGRSEQLSIAIHAGSFQQAKADIEIALGKHIESLLKGDRGATAIRAA